MQARIPSTVCHGNVGPVKTLVRGTEILVLLWNNGPTACVMCRSPLLQNKQLQFVISSGGSRGGSQGAMEPPFETDSTSFSKL